MRVTCCTLTSPTALLRCTTWAEPLEWVKLKSPFGLEVHLMVDHPEEYADNWLAAGARRLIVHMESLTAHSLHDINALAERYHAEVMLSSKPEDHRGGN